MRPAAVGSRDPAPSEERPPDRPDLRLALPAVAAWLVAWQSRALPPSVVLTAAGAVALLAVLLLLRSRSGGALVVAAVLGCSAAAGTVTALHVGARTGSPVADLARERAAVTVEAVLVTDPRRAAARTRGGQELVVAEVRVERLVARGRAVALRTPVLVLATEGEWLGLLPSQRVRLDGRLRPAEPGDDVAAVLSAGAPELLGGPSAVQRAAGHLRAGLRAAVAPLPDAEQGLLPGLVVGDVSRLDPQLREDFRTTGLSHLTAVSGTNVSIVVGAVLLLSRRLRAGLLGSPVLAAVALAGFVVLARPSPSVLRAAVMGVVGLVALASGGRRAALPALSAAVLALVLLQPDLAAAPGFALSVLATGGLLLLAPPWREALARRMPGWLADALAVPAAAQVACGPVVVAISASLGLLSVPANLLAVPAVVPATLAGVLAAVLAPVWLPVAQAVAWLGYLPTAWLVLVARTGAGVPGASVPWPDGGTGALLLLALTAVALPLLARRRPRRLLAAVLAGALLAGTALAAVRPAWPPSGWFMVACDVGQGDAVVLRAGPGAAVLVDVGPDPRRVDRCLDRLEVERVPVVVLTHLHADHVDGLSGVLSGRAVGQLQLGATGDPAAAAEVVERAQSGGVPVVQPRLGEVRRAGELSWRVIAPSRSYGDDPNNSSVVLRAQVGPTSVLLTGDVEPEAQRDLLRSEADLRATVLKVPHHGSRHQDPSFLRAVDASVAVTSVGADNTYGHPSSETLGVLEDAGARSLRTDRDGDVALVHRAGRLLAVGSRRGPPSADQDAPPAAVRGVPPGVQRGRAHRRSRRRAWDDGRRARRPARPPDARRRGRGAPRRAGRVGRRPRGP